jgi:type II secretory pathway pseudopilin PulG
MFKNRNPKEKRERKKGFTLLYALLVSILVLAVGASMVTISLKQIVLSSSSRESQFAFYASNTGYECALYWDLKGAVEKDGVIKYVFPPPGEENRNDLSNVKCNGGNIITGEGFGMYPFVSQFYIENSGIWKTETLADGAKQTTFRMAVFNTNSPETDDVQYCTEVTVLKEFDDFSEDFVTTITSQGLNSCNPEYDVRAVERGTQIQYRE